MGFFGFGSKDTVKQSWLSRADEAYTKALIYGNAAIFDNYGTVDFCSELANRILGGYRIFAGTEKYKKVSWVLKSKNKETHTKVYIKNVTYDSIKYARDIRVSVSNDYREEWTVVNNGTTLVENILRC